MHPTDLQQLTLRADIQSLSRLIFFMLFIFFILSARSSQDHQRWTLSGVSCSGWVPREWAEEAIEFLVDLYMLW